MAINFKTGYNPQAFRNFLRVNLLGDKFNEYSTPERLLPGKTQYFVNNEIYRIGEIKGIEKDVSILQIKQKSKNDPRVSLTKDTFKLMQDYGIKNAIVVLRVDNVSSWRLSLLTTSYNEDLKKEMSNPRRFSYILGPYEKVRTPEQYLIEQGFIESFQDLKDRFNVEVVRKNFFTLYIDLFLEVYNNIITNNVFSEIIKEGEIEPVSFAKNLMGKLIFLYFIQKKGWLGIRDKNIPFGEGDRDFFKHNIERLATEGNLFHQHSNFYNDFLEPLFYSGLNQKNPDDRHEELQMKVPYLNGGLFEKEYDWQDTTINLNNQIFKNIIDSFDTYNFTIDEDDPIDSEIAVDPEMLGMIFESMISITKDNIDEHLERFKKAKEKNKIDFVNQDNILNLHLTKGNNKDLGAFYTPRENVNYKTKESIFNYLVSELQKKNPSEQEEINNIVRKLFEYKDKHLTKGEIDEQEEAGYSLIKKYVFDIKEALTNIKILDPAVGSGAFPMGILQEVLRLTRYLIDVFHLEKKSNYEIKKDIIQNNIHGVDIDPGAVDIARLRFWLCLIVDADYPVPLPNLDFKFVCANSLIPLDEGSLFVNEELIRRLKDIKDLYFSCSEDKKDEMKDLFMKEKQKFFAIDFELLNELKGKSGKPTKEYQKVIDEYAKGNADKRTKQINDRQPFDTRISNERFDPYMMFDESKFDIIIGNPPYIKEYENRDAFNGFREISPYYMGKMDLRYGFACHGIDLLKDNGILCFIAQNNWTTSAGAKKMRNKVIKDSRILQLMDFNTYMIFENAQIQTMVMIFQKNSDIDNYNFDLRVLKSNAEKEDLIKMLNNDKTGLIKYLNPHINRNNSLDSLLTFSENEDFLQRISKDKLFLNNKEATNGIHPHHDFVNKKINEAYPELGIGRGIFGLSEEEKESLNLDSHELELIKPYYTSEEIHKYFTERKNKLRLIYTDSSFKDTSKINGYPHIKSHIDLVKQAITSDNKPYGLHRARERHFFEGEKIVVMRKCVGRPLFSYSDFDCFVSATFYIIQTKRRNMKFLTGILNSKLIAFWLKNKGKMQGDNYQIDKEPLQSIPLPNMKGDDSIIVSLVDRILSLKSKDVDADTSEIEVKIDNEVYKLYGLTEDEIKIVEESIK